MTYRSYETSAGQIKRAAARFLRRAHLAGARSVQLDDVVSECNVAWCIARDKFDPAQGVPFAAYLARGLINHINRWIDEQIGHVGLALDDETEGDWDDMSIHEVIADEAPTPAAVFEELDVQTFALEQLSNEARTFVELLLNPPRFLFEEVEAVQGRASWARERGISSASPKGITGDLVFNLMGIERAGRNRIYGELKALARFMTQEVTQ